MILLKPAWVKHEDNKPIFSVDIHPKGGRFATGGQGGQGGRIVIWNIAPILSYSDENDPNIPKQLCQMDNHLACVNVVRWSCQGHLLASGGDDKLVMIWKLTGEGSSTLFGSGGKVNVETWKCTHTLNSHNGDILDLAWAPHDGWLASASVDNTVIIWNTHKFPEKVAVLKGHSGMVKGVTWDPVGKYIASQSDDKSLRVWRTADWQQQEVVTDAFVDCSATTHVLRLSWSPDGQYLVSAHAMNGGGPTAQIIERDGWKQDKDFVGHRKAVTCVRFNSNILKKVTPGSPKPQQYCCCAVGSRDKSVSVWLTSLKRPLVVIKDLFDDSVLDISWSSNGQHLLACSWDGSVACIIFTTDAIGNPLSECEKDSLYERMYGKSMQRNLLNSSFVGSHIIEYPEMLSEQDAINDISMKQMNEINVEIPKITIPTINLESPKQNGLLVASNKQIETRLPSGKRRITPMFLKPVPTTPVKETVEVPTIQAASTFSSSSPTKSKIVVVQEKVKQTNIIPSHSSLIPSVRPQTFQPPGVQINQLTCSEVPGDQPIVQFINVLDPLKMPLGQTITKKNDFMKLQVTNGGLTTPKGKLARIEVFKHPDDKQPIWETYLGSVIKCIQYNRRLIVACCEDLSINTYEIKCGARPLPPLLIEDVASALCLSDSGICMVLTKTGLLHMWNIDLGKSILNRISLRSLLSNKASVSGCSLTTTDLPLVTLSDGRAFIYNLDLQTWVLISNPQDTLSKVSGSIARSVGGNLPLASLQRQMSAHNLNDNLPSGVKLSFLESQISASVLLQSASEFRHWLLITVTHLLEKGPECRIRSILDELMGPTHSSSKKPRTDNILGISKKKLLNEVLALIKSKLHWQRLYKEYNEQLNLLNL
ncbi:PREDICTED: protein HIRA homolog [Nicrophorus vespilloides]|uniref:Protein HIRA n=1 Tax=Nicrophorus vespilloides TaxID=110193 RepID=A0ABM1M2L6_NICVS|nr:PREDICTED: protein HIRA homolog [Nicrophorus vespilloides]XP_017768817.1 PREDICTED: protein HIRA homolog [Nicrophorus vespilloides]